MRIDDLRLFLSVVELGNFAAVAHSLDVPRAQVSRRIGDLEQALGCKLFTRTTRKLALTPAGTDYFMQLQEIIPRLETLNQSIKNQSSAPTGSVKLGLIGDADILAHDLLLNFLSQYPLITLETHVSNLGYHDIMNYGLDACVHIGKMQDSSFIARPLTTVSRKLYASPGYLAEHGMPQRLEDLQQHALLIHRLASGELEDCWNFNTGPLKVSSRLISNSSHYIRYAVLKGAGISLLPELSVKAQVTSGELLEILPAHKVYLDDAWLVYPSRKGMTHAARLLIDSLLAESALLLN